MDSSKQNPEEAQVYSPDTQKSRCGPAFRSAPSSKHLELHHVVVSALILTFLTSSSLFIEY